MKMESFHYYSKHKIYVLYKIPKLNFFSNLNIFNFKLQLNKNAQNICKNINTIIIRAKYEHSKKSYKKSPVQQGFLWWRIGDSNS